MGKCGFYRVRSILQKPLSVSVSVSAFCLCLSVYLSLCRYLCLSVFLCVSLSLCLLVCLCLSDSLALTHSLFIFGRSILTFKSVIEVQHSRVRVSIKCTYNDMAIGATREDEKDTPTRTRSQYGRRAIRPPIGNIENVWGRDCGRTTYSSFCILKRVWKFKEL